MKIADDTTMKMLVIIFSLSLPYSSPFIFQNRLLSFQSSSLYRTKLYRQATSASGSINITESAFPGAGRPRPDLTPEEIPSLLMEALSFNDFPDVDSGLKSMWDFAGDTTRHIFQHNRTDFIESAHETANQFPTSFYGNAFYGKSWEIETPLNRVGDDNNDTCWIATQVIKTISSDGRLRRWQWELRKNRRPPHLNCWYVETIGSSDRKGQFEAE